MDSGGLLRGKGTTTGSWGSVEEQWDTTGSSLHVAQAGIIAAYVCGRKPTAQVMEWLHISQWALGLPLRAAVAQPVGPGGPELLAGFPFATPCHLDKDKTVSKMSWPT